MIAVAERPTAAFPSFDTRSSVGADARDLAMSYLRYASACWRGDAVAGAFATGLGACWRRDMPPAPAARPDAVSPHGGGGRGIRWYQTGGDVLGYVSGAQGGYHVPVGAIPRLRRCIPATPHANPYRFEPHLRKSSDEREQDSDRCVLHSPSAHKVKHRALAIA